MEDLQIDFQLILAKMRDKIANDAQNIALLEATTEVYKGMVDEYQSVVNELQKKVEDLEKQVEMLKQINENK